MPVSDERPRLAFVGAGRLGNVLARACHAAGYDVIACSSRTSVHADRLASQIPGCVARPTAGDAASDADWVFLTVTDDAIPAVAASIPWRHAQLAVHCSGALPAAVMQSASTAGARTAGFHPLQTFANAELGLARLPKSSIGIEADDVTWTHLERLARALGANPLRIEADARALYHLGSVIVSNFTVGLVGLAERLWAQIGIEPVTAVTALLPLLDGTVRNVEALGVRSALTGPVVRGDSGTAALHLAALRGHTRETAAYIALSRVLVELAVESGRLPPDRAATIHAALDTVAMEEPGDPIPTAVSNPVDRPRELSE
jgi:predicted short-subunit dehydrogenase-like oxidoreductase (DUF2520 family)